jgi:hypothetical protein
VITKPYAKSLILRHGHLIVTGAESKDELIEALVNLRKHTYATCHRPWLGSPIESIIPDVSILYPKIPARTRREVKQ